MTIKELCKNMPKCEYCSFEEICPYVNGEFVYPLSDIIEIYNDKITKSIIETAKMLLEGEV